MPDLININSDSNYDAVYTSRDPDTNAITADGVYTSYNTVRVRKSGDTNSALAPSTGVNAAILAKNRANLTLYDCYIDSNGKHSPAIFGKDVETKVIVYRSAIYTNNENSPVIATYGGSVEAYNCDIISNYENSPALDIYGYTTTVRGGNIITRSEKSPIAVVRSDLNFFNVDNMSSNMSDGFHIIGDEAIINSQESTININASGYYPEDEDTTIDHSEDFIGVYIGSESGKISGTFTANGGAINTDRPEYTTVFKVQNADGEINLTGVKLNNGYNKLLSVNNTTSSKGKTKFTVINQTLSGIIEVDENSELNLELKSNSSYTGRINQSGQSGTVNVTLINSFWSLSGDAYISKLTLDKTSTINLNGYTLWVSGYKYIPEGEEGGEDEEGEVEYIDTFTNENDNEHACEYISTSGILSTSRVIKSGNTNEYDANEYGNNAAVLVNDSNVTVANKTYITTEGIGSPGVTSYNNSSVSVNDSIIETTGDNSSAVSSSHGGSLYLYNATLSTEGERSHVVNMVPLSGNVVLNGGSYTAKGEGSAVINIDKENTGTIRISDSTIRSDLDNGINVNGVQPGNISISGSSIYANKYGISVVDYNNDHNNITLDISNTYMNSYGAEDSANIYVNSAEVTINLTKCNLYGGSILRVVNNSIVYLNVSAGYLSGGIYVDDTSILYINLMENGNIVGFINTNDTAEKINMVMRDGDWVLTQDSFITSLDIDKYSNINIGERTLYVNRVASDFIVGSVVHYTSEDNTISEEDVVIIEKTTVGENTTFTLYDTDDRVTYNDVSRDQLVFTGKIIDIDPILQLIDEMARDESAGVVESGDTVVASTSNKHSLLVDGTTVELEDIHIKKTGDSKFTDDISNTTVLVTNGGNLTLKNSDINSKATYANGIISVGEGSIVNATNVEVLTESINSSAAIAMDKGVIKGNNLNLSTTGPKSYGARVEGDGFLDLENSTISVAGVGSNGIIIKDSDLTLKSVTISHDRSIAPIDISGECNIILSGGNISDNSSEIATGGLYIHNERSTDPVYPDGYDEDDNPPHDDDGGDTPTPPPVPIDPDIYVLRGAYHYTVDYDLDGGVYTNTVASVDNPDVAVDEIVIWVSLGALGYITDATIIRSNDKSTGGKNSERYGVGAAVLISNGGLEISNTTINTLALGGNALFAYSAASHIKADSVNISTLESESAGLQVADGGIIEANSTNVTAGTNVSVESPAIRVSKGGGSIKVDHGTYYTGGFDSPAIVNNGGVISVDNANLTTVASELIDIIGAGEVEFDNTIAIFNHADDSDNDCSYGIGMYQINDFITDSSICKFTSNGGNIRSKHGGIFYITNTEAEINLSYTNIIRDNSSDFFIRVTGNSGKKNRGTPGSNGGKCIVNLSSQLVTGNVYWDSLSTLTINLTNVSELTGAIINDESFNGGTIGSEGYCDLNIDNNSKFIVTGNCRLRNITNNSNSLIRDNNGKIVTIVNTNNTLIIEGNSDYVISIASYSGITEES